jgi:hypothetical protein
MPLYFASISRIGGAEAEGWYASARPVEKGKIIRIKGILCRVEHVHPIPSGDPHDGNLLCVEVES